MNNLSDYDRMKNERLPDPLFVRRPYLRHLSPRHRFDQYARPCPMSGCHLWVGAVSGDGYGTLTVGGRQHAAHRWIWEYERGPVASGLHICHRCDVPLCVNPDHMFLGTNQDNMTDMVRKGRDLRNGRAWSAKLTVEQVRAIRATGAQPGANKTDIARQYGVGRSVVGRIL